MSTIASKNTSIGYVEIRTTSMGYGLYVGGVLKEQSADLNYIRNQYDKY